MAEKDKPRGLLDLLGKGAARNAGDAISRRKAKIDEAVDGPKKKIKK